MKFATIFSFVLWLESNFVILFSCETMLIGKRCNELFYGFVFKGFKIFLWSIWSYEEKNMRSKKWIEENFQILLNWREDIFWKQNHSVNKNKILS